MKRIISAELIQLISSIERHGSITKAAEALEKTAAAVSQQITKAEETHGFTIYQRVGRGVELTAAGRMLFDEGQEIVLALEKLQSKAQDIATGWRHILRLGVESTHDEVRLLSKIKEFLVDHPLQEIHLSSTVLNGGFEQLRSGEIDLLVGALEPIPSHLGLKSKMIGTQTMVLSGSPTLIASYRNIETVIKSARRVILHDSSDSEVRRSAGLNANARSFFVSDMSQKVAAIRAGIGIGHIPEHLLKQTNESIVPLALGAHRHTIEEYAVWKVNQSGRAALYLANLL